MNNAYVVLLSSRFQRFCRDLHTEAAAHLGLMVPASFRATFITRLMEGRKLDTGNPNPGNIGSDFARLGLQLWQQPLWQRPARRRDRDGLDRLNRWRNAIAHDDFASPAFGSRSAANLAEVRRWRRACGGLARTFDDLLGHHLSATSGRRAW